MWLFGVFSLRVCYFLRKRGVGLLQDGCEEEGKGGIYRLFVLGGRSSVCDSGTVYFW